MRFETARVARAGVRALRRGHPWIAAGDVEALPPAGTPVRLVDGRGRHLGFGLADRGPIAVRVLGRSAVPIPELLRRRVRQAEAARACLAAADTDCWRVVNGAGDALPGLVVDRYGSVAVVRLYSVAWEPHLDAVAAAVADLPGITSVVRRLGVRRVDGGRGVAHLLGPPVPERLVVREHGMRFLVRPAVGQKTGLFLDQRDSRARIRALRCTGEVTNLFGYTGGFSVAAALGGARRVVTVDTAGAALEDARENFRLNGLDPSRHAFEAADAFGWRAPRPAALVVCDPPSLARRAGGEEAALRVYAELAAHAGRQVAPGGWMLSASCTARVGPEAWGRAVRAGLRRAGRWAWTGRWEAPLDHPVALEHDEGRYLKVVLVRRIVSGAGEGFGPAR